MDTHVLFFLLRRTLLPVASVLIVLTIVGGLMMWARFKGAWARRTQQKRDTSSTDREIDTLFANNARDQSPGSHGLS